MMFRGANDAANRAVQDAVIQKQRRPRHEIRSHLAVRAPQFRFVGRYRAVNPFRPLLCDLCGDPWREEFQVWLGIEIIQSLDTDA